MTVCAGSSFWAGEQGAVFQPTHSHLLAASRSTYSNIVSTRQKSLMRKTVVTRSESLIKDVAVQISGCSKCLSLLLPVKEGLQLCEV